MNWWYPFKNSVDRLERAIGLLAITIINTRKDIMGNFDKLDTVVDALSAKVDTVTATLAGLAQEVVDLKSKVANPTFDSTADVNRLAGKAQAILDKLAVAEAAAEPELPVQAAAPAAQPVAVDTPAVATETPAA